MDTGLYAQNGRVGRITLDRSGVLDATDDEVPGALAEAAGQPDARCSATIVEGTRRCSPHGLDFRPRAERVDSTRAVRERDPGAFD